MMSVEQGKRVLKIEAEAIRNLVDKIDAWDGARPLVPPSLVAGHERAP